MPMSLSFTETTTHNGIGLGRIDNNKGVIPCPFIFKGDRMTGKEIRDMLIKDAFGETGKKILELLNGQKDPFDEEEVRRKVRP